MYNPRLSRSVLPIKYQACLKLYFIINKNFIKDSYSLNLIKWLIFRDKLFITFYSKIHVYDTSLVIQQKGTLKHRSYHCCIFCTTLDMHSELINYYRILRLVNSIGFYLWVIITTNKNANYIGTLCCKQLDNNVCYVYQGDIFGAM